ncbi:hypothetical protein CGCTS75_v008153 [Colletotrichum tropicale]|nr:hypothetical protein CGCTS75_v008153 [Colletotrichum tropicale]
MDKHSSRQRTHTSTARLANSLSSLPTDFQNRNRMQPSPQTGCSLPAERFNSPGGLQQRARGSPPNKEKGQYRERVESHIQALVSQCARRPHSKSIL